MFSKKITVFFARCRICFLLDWKQYGVGACSAEFQLIARLFLFSFCPVQQRIALPKIHPVIFYTVFTWNLDLLKILFQNQIMIQNPQKSRYFRSGNCFGKLSSNSFWKLWKEKFYLCFIRRNDSQNVEFFSQIFDKKYGPLGSLIDQHLNILTNNHETFMTTKSK